MPHIWLQNSLFAVKLVRNFIFLFLILCVHAAVAQQNADSAVVIKLEDKSSNHAVWRKELVQKWNQKGYFTAKVDSLSPETVVLTKGILYDSLFVTTENSVDTLFMNTAEYNRWCESKLRAYENSGFPFASVSAVVVWQQNTKIGIQSVFETGNKYVFDTMMFEDEVLHPRFVRFVSGIKVGEVYKQSQTDLLFNKLNSVDGLFLPAGPVLVSHDDKISLKLPLVRKNKDYISGIIGLATSTGKPVFTGDVRGKFYNLFGFGVSLFADWRSYRPRSQQLELKTSIPFVFGLPFITGMGVQFDKFDTLFSVFSRSLQVKFPVSREFSFTAGTAISDRIRIFADVNTVRNFRSLPENPAARTRNYYMGVDFGNIVDGMVLRKGYRFSMQASAGTRKFIRDPRFTEITWVSSGGNLINIYDSLESAGKMKVLQYKIEYNWEWLLPVGKVFSLKLGGQGLEMLAPELFFNELQRFGGIKSIRGFNEQSIFAGKFHMFLTEWRIVTGKSGYFGPFYNAGYAVNNSVTGMNQSLWLQGAGISAALKTGAGVLQIVWAAGKTNSQPFDLNSSKFHFGLSNTF